jgi:hypothetical protein
VKHEKHNTDFGEHLKRKWGMAVRYRNKGEGVRPYCDAAENLADD